MYWQLHNRLFCPCMLPILPSCCCGLVIKAQVKDTPVSYLSRLNLLNNIYINTLHGVRKLSSTVSTCVAMTMQFEHPKIDWDAADLYQEFQRFRSHVSFVFAGPLSALVSRQKAGWIGTWIGEQGREIYKTLEWADGEKDDPVKVLDKFAGYIRPRKNKRIARHRFKQRKQGTTETFDHFVKDLRLLLLDCEYADSDDMLIGAIIAGVK